MPSNGPNSSTLTPAPSQVGSSRRPSLVVARTKSEHPKRQSAARKFLERMKFREDYRQRLPLQISRFLGYRPPDREPPFEALPLPPFMWLYKIPLRIEVWIMGWIGAFGGILLIEAIMGTSTAFRDVYHAPLIVTSFGASAVLVFGSTESPLAQPRNFVLGHFISALVGTCITRLFALNRTYNANLDNLQFHPATFINGGLSMATSLLAMLITGTVHPPAGATGLNAAVLGNIVTLSWRYLPTVLASSLIMLGWALIINNVGRRRYPIYWWSPGSSLVRNAVDEEELALKELEEARLRKYEDQGRTPEGLLLERIEGGGGDMSEVERATSQTGRDVPFRVARRDTEGPMSPSDRERAQGPLDEEYIES